MQTWRRTELLHVLEVITISSHASSQVLGEVRRRLVDVFLRPLLPDVYRATYSSSIVLGFGWKMYGHFEHMQ